MRRILLASLFVFCASNLALAANVLGMRWARSFMSKIVKRLKSISRCRNSKSCRQRETDPFPKTKTRPPNVIFGIFASITDNLQNLSKSLRA